MLAGFVQARSEWIQAINWAWETEQYNHGPKRQIKCSDERVERIKHSILTSWKPQKSVRKAIDRMPIMLSLTGLCLQGFKERHRRSQRLTARNQRTERRKNADDGEERARTSAT